MIGDSSPVCEILAVKASDHSNCLRNCGQISSKVPFVSGQRFSAKSWSTKFVRILVPCLCVGIVILCLSQGFVLLT
uniref:Uncharacterized protein n=1 Tax=Arundo donax TaxID=35708 RepID=A0A0A8YQ14_ARUDO